VNDFNHACACIMLNRGKQGFFPVGKRQYRSYSRWKYCCQQQ